MKAYRLGLLVTGTSLLAAVVPGYLAAFARSREWERGWSVARRPVVDLWFRDLTLLAVGLAVSLAFRRYSGLRPVKWSQLRDLRVVAAVAVPLVGASIYRFALSERWQLDSDEWTLWLLQPLGQELIFSGLLLGLLASGPPSIRCNRWTAIVLTSTSFALWHFWADWFREDLEFVVFRLGYTGGGYLLYCWLRLRTNSIAIPVALHMAVNFIALGP